MTDRGAAGRIPRLAREALAAHILAGLAMAAVLGRGLATNPDAASRMRFVAGHRALWTLSWLCWTAASFTILRLFRALAARHRVPFAVMLTVAAVGLDLSAQLLEALACPLFAARGLSGGFLEADRTAVVLTGGFANALYTLAAGGLAWRARRAYPNWVSLSAGGVVFGGAALSAAAYADSPAGLFWSNAALVPCLVAWLWGLAVSVPGDAP